MNRQRRLATFSFFIAIAFSSATRADVRKYATAGLDDPLAQKERHDVTWGGLQCAVNTAVLSLTGGTVAAALTPDLSRLIFDLVREEVEADPASFTLPMPLGQLQDAFQRLIDKVSQNPGLIANTAMVTLMSKGGPPGALKLFSDIAVIRTLAECGITIYRGVVQLSKDVPALVQDVKAMRASQAALTRLCADYDGWVACNRACFGTRQALETWIPNCSRSSSEYELAINEVAVEVGRACHRDYCASPKRRRDGKAKQCRVEGLSNEWLNGLRSRACSR